MLQPTVSWQVQQGVDVDELRTGQTQQERMCRMSPTRGCRGRGMGQTETAEADVQGKQPSQL